MLCATLLPASAQASTVAWCRDCSWHTTQGTLVKSGQCEDCEWLDIDIMPGGSFISSIADAFSGLPGLRDLNVRTHGTVQIGNLSAIDFREMPLLQHFRLERWPLAGLAPDTFANNTNLDVDLGDETGLGCVPAGGIKSVRAHLKRMGGGGGQLPRCPDDCRAGTVYNASGGNCVDCPVGMQPMGGGGTVGGDGLKMCVPSGSHAVWLNSCGAGRVNARSASGGCAFWRDDKSNVLHRTGNCAEDCKGPDIWLSPFRIKSFAEDVFRGLPLLGTISLAHGMYTWDEDVGCVPISESMRVTDSFGRTVQTPRCPSNCTPGTYFKADAHVCLLCPEGKYTWGVGAVNCSDIQISSSSSSTSVAPTAPSPFTTTPSPNATIIICEGDTKLSTVNGIDLCVPLMLYPAENVSHCIFDKTWEDVQANRYIFQTGGLGNKMRGPEWKVWVCGAQLPCAIEEQDWVCFTYNEFHDVFVPLGYNRELLIVRHRALLA